LLMTCHMHCFHMPMALPCMRLMLMFMSSKMAAADTLSLMSSTALNCRYIADAIVGMLHSR